MAFIGTQRLAIALLVGLVCCGFVRPNALLGQGESAPRIENVSVGIDGRFKLGFWTSLRVEVVGGQQPSSCRLVWVASDGEGVNVEYEDAEAFSIGANEALSIERLVRVGRTRSAIEVRLLDENDRVISSTRSLLTPEQGVLGSDEFLIVGIGDECGFTRWTRQRESQTTAQTINFLRSDSPASLPTDWVALENIDLLVVSSSREEMWADTHRARWEAVRRWVSDGGVLILAMGSQGPLVAAETSPLRPLLPGDFESVVQQNESAGAEMFTAAVDQLLTERGASFAASRLVNVKGDILAYEGQNSKDLPLVVKHSYGMGQVLWVGVDLDREPFASWKARPTFIGKLMDAILPDAVEDEGGRRGRVGHLGYSDLSGQLRGSLDDFGQVMFVTFTSVAVLVTFFILLIGPGDYWLLKLVFRRMEWTWVTSGIVVVLFCVLAVIIFISTKGNRVQVNQAEMLDIDARTGQVRGTLWAHVYAPRLKQFDLWLDRDNEFSSREGRTILTWQGLSGGGLGGMDAQLISNLQQTGYRSIPMADSAAGSNQLKGMTVQVASTRPVTGRWWDTLKEPVESSLYADLRNNTLHGDITNPLPMTLDRAVVFYDTWAYEVIGDLEPGETISIEGQTTERTLESALARRQVVDGNDVSEPWDPKGTNAARILELMSFYRSGGGRDYTSLYHRMHAELDWSGQLEQGHAVLFARANSPVGRLHDGQQSLADDYDNTTIMVRILLPVEMR